MMGNGLIRLRKPEEEDLDPALAWVKNGDYFSFLTGDTSLLSTIDTREMVLNQFAASFCYDSNIYRVAETTEGASMGMILFHSINWKSRNAFMGLHIKESRLEENYIFAIFPAAFNFAFQELNLHKISVHIFEYNNVFIDIAKKAGAKREQVFKKHFNHKNKFYDVYVYSLLKSEYGPDRIVI